MGAPDRRDPVTHRQRAVAVRRDVLDREIVLHEDRDQRGKRQGRQQELHDGRRAYRGEPVPAPGGRAQQAEHRLGRRSDQGQHHGVMTELGDHVRGTPLWSGFTGITPPCFSLMARATSGGM